MRPGESAAGGCGPVICHHAMTVTVHSCDQARVRGAVTVVPGGRARGLVRALRGDLQGRAERL